MMLAAMVATAACGSDSVTGPGGGSAQLRVVNSSSNTVMYVRTRACGTTPWGADLLGPTEIMARNSYITRSMAPGCVDVRLTPSEAGADYYYFTNVMLQNGKQTTVTVTQFPAE